jgi:CRISPR-associated protein Cas6
MPQKYLDTSVMTDTAESFVDLQFAIQGSAVALDYADALWLAVRDILPWLADDALAGIHPLSGLSPGVGDWNLSRRSRLTLRLARAQAAAASSALSGARLKIADNAIEVGSATVRELTHTPVIYAKFVSFVPADSANATIGEDEFYAACCAGFSAMGITPKVLCGKPQQAKTSSRTLSGFSVMLLELDAAATAKIQREGLGGDRKHGCGIFVPHKSVAAVGTLE